MKVCVLGLWHLGTVTAACLASGGHEVVGLDFDAATIQDLQAGKPPLFEPGLGELVAQGLLERRLSFTTDAAAALAEAEIVWVAYDTPVDDDDRADVDFVIERVRRLFPHLRDGMLVLVSSQVPVGTTGRLEREYAESRPERKVSFACLPENLRLGKAISVFTRPDRVVAGVRSEQDTGRIRALFRPFTERIEWMTVESAEMTKHALNAFLALSITFANEIAALCEQMGADAKEVERGLKSEDRIGPKAYLAPGTAFAGGTLARDIAFLTAVGSARGLPNHLLAAVRMSNDAHRLWVGRTLVSLLGQAAGKNIAVWGLTYKPGTDTLRRSGSVELCRWLAGQGARVTAHDPAVRTLPGDLAREMTLCGTPLAALAGAEALVVATEWPEYRMVQPGEVLSIMAVPVVVDPNRFLVGTLGSDRRIRYAAVGYRSPGDNRVPHDL